MTNVITTASIENIIIDQELRNVLSIKASEEYADLKESISKEGIRDPLVIGIIDDREYLVDGHNRFRIGEELGIKEVPICKITFASKDEAKMWIFHNQCIRRNLNMFQRIESALQLKAAVATKAKENQQAGVSLNSGEGLDTGKEIAKLAKTSSDTVRKVERILEKASPEDVDALRRGDTGMSIEKVYQKYNGKKVPDTPIPIASEEPTNDILPNSQNEDETKPTPEETETLQTEDTVDTNLPPEVCEGQPQTFEDELDGHISGLNNTIVNGNTEENRVNFLDSLCQWANGLIQWAQGQKEAELQRTSA